MGWHLGIVFRSVTIRCGRGFEGWVWFCEPLGSADTPEGLERAVLIYLAGPMAAWPLERRFRSLRARTDLEQAYRLVQRISATPDEVPERWAALKERAWNPLAARPVWAAVTRLAMVLLERQTLSGLQARALLRPAEAACRGGDQLGAVN